MQFIFAVLCFVALCYTAPLFLWFGAVLCGLLPVAMLLYWVCLLADLTWDGGQIWTFVLLAYVAVVALLWRLFYWKRLDLTANDWFMELHSPLMHLGMVGVGQIVLFIIAKFGFHAAYPGQFLSWLF